MIAADYPFLEVLGTMLIFFAWVIWFWLLITVFADIFRRRDTSGGSNEPSPPIDGQAEVQKSSRSAIVRSNASCSSRLPPLSKSAWSVSMG